MPLKTECRSQPPDWRVLIAPESTLPPSLRIDSSFQNLPLSSALYHCCHVPPVRDCAVSHSTQRGSSDVSNRCRFLMIVIPPEQCEGQEEPSTFTYALSFGLRRLSAIS